MSSSVEYDNFINFDYDIKNLTRICAAIQNYKNATPKKIDFTGDSKNKDADNELEAEKEIKKTITIEFVQQEMNYVYIDRNS